MASAESEKLAAIHVEIELHWGYSIVKPFYTAYQPSFKIVPPTTLIGALAYPYAVLNGEPESTDQFSTAVKMLDYVLWVTEKLEIDPRFIVETTELTRYITTLGVRMENLYRGSPYLWTVQQRGRVYAQGQLIHAVYITRRAGDLERYAWGIWRIGSRETPVSVRSVDILQLQLLNRGAAHVEYMFPQRLAKHVKGMYVLAELPSIEKAVEWFRFGVKSGGGLMEIYTVPVEPVEVEVASNAQVIVDERGAEYLVPKSVTEGGG